MRTIHVEIGGRPFDLTATFAAAKEIAGKVADPFYIFREAALDTQMSAVGIAYNPRFSLTVENVPMILWIGAKTGGSKVTLAEMQELVFDHGFMEAKAPVMDYLAIMVTPTALEKIEPKKDDTPGE